MTKEPNYKRAWGELIEYLGEKRMMLVCKESQRPTDKGVTLLNLHCQMTLDKMDELLEGK